MDPILTHVEQRLLDGTAGKPSATPDEMLNLAAASKTNHRREHAYPVYRPADPWRKGATVELARVSSPSGLFTVLQRIDTVIIDETTGNAIGDWTNPNNWQSAFNFVLVLSASQQTGDQAQRRIVNVAPNPNANIARLTPGVPFMPLPSWDDDRFAWGNPSNEIAIPVQKNQVLRLFVYCNADISYRHSVKGRLVTTQQSEKSLAAKWNAERELHG